MKGNYIKPKLKTLSIETSHILTTSNEANSSLRDLGYEEEMAEKPN